MKIAFKLIITVSFIFSFFFFLSKPAFADFLSDMESWRPASTYSFSAEVVADITSIVYSAWNYKFGTNTGCEVIKWSAFARPQFDYYYGTHSLADSVFIYFHTNPTTCVSSDTKMASAVHNNKNYIQYGTSANFRPPDLIWTTKNNCYTVNGGSIQWTLSNYNTCAIFSPHFPLSDIAYSNLNIAKYNDWTNNLSLDYGGLGTSINLVTPYTFMYANYDDNWNEIGYVAPPASTFTYFIEYRDNFVSNSWLRLESSKPAYISASWAEGANLFGFDGGEWQLYETNGTQRSLLDSSSSYYPPYLYIVDHNNPCASLGRSNYSLRDDNGDFLCPATNNPVVDDIAPPFEGKINFVIEDHDWGVFDWLRVPAKILFDAIDGALVWFNDLWRGLLSQLIPMPDFLSFFGQDISNAFNEKIDIASYTAFVDDLNSLQDENESEMPNLTGSLMGVEVPLIDFSIIKDNISIIRAITTTFLILYIAYFNINAITLILNSKKFLSRE